MIDQPVPSANTFLVLTSKLNAHALFPSSLDFLREDTLVGTSFLRVAAHDDDFGTNAAITYSMSLEQPEYLRVNPVTGWVYVNQPISQVSHLLLAAPCQPERTFTHKHTHTRAKVRVACGFVSTKLMNEPPQSASVCLYQSGECLLPEGLRVPQRGKMEGDKFIVKQII